MTAPVSASGWLTLTEVLSQVGHYDGPRFVPWPAESMFTARVEWHGTRAWTWSIVIGHKPSIGGSATTQAEARAEVERRLAEHETRMRAEVSRA